MKQPILVIALLCQYLCGHSQSTDSIRPLTVGDTVPDIFFSRIIHYPKTSAHLSDFKGKAIIIDFWSIYCGPCITGLPILDSIQNKYSDKLFVLPVSQDNESMASHFMQVHNKLSLPTAVDTMGILQKYFPHTSIPHTILINSNGVVAGISDVKAINKTTIGSMVANRPLDVVFKNDNLTINYNLPLEINGNGDLTDHDVIYRSMVARHRPGVKSVFVDVMRNDTIIGLHYVNIYYTQMYLDALRQPQEWMYSRVFYAKGDSLIRFLDSMPTEKSHDYERWENENTFSYEVLGPKLTPEQLNKTMINDLDNALAAEHLKVTWENRRIPVLLLKVVDKKLVRTSGKEWESYVNETDTVTTINHSLSEITAFVEGPCGVPVLYESKDNLHIDMKYLSVLAKDDSAAGRAYNKAFWMDVLAKYGMTLVPAVRDIDVLVIRHTR